MIKNIIFDLGGVILDLSVVSTIKEFARVSGLDPEKVRELFISAPGFLAYEKGEISDHEFRQFVRELYRIDASDEVLDNCWNAMLLTIPPARLELLTNLKLHFNTFLLSNTNTIHVDCINSKILPAMDGVRALEDFFDKTYYSHLMKKRKPEPEIFLQLLEENDLKAGETLFLDDNAAN